MKLGVCYYPEHWGSAYWQRDADAMAELGIEYVRIAEFIWNYIEPVENRFEFANLDKVVEIFYKAGLKLVMSTPTAAPPKWLLDKYPEVLPVSPSGITKKGGSRRSYSFSSRTYRKLAARITNEVTKRYGNHPAVVAWQVDNEYGCHNSIFSYSEADLLSFREWLKKRYDNSIDKLNDAWGNLFWGMTYNDFDQIETPNNILAGANFSHQLDWRRFSSDMVIEFNKEQVDIIRSNSPGRPVHHNFMGCFNQFDHFKLSEDLDFVTWDSYPLGHLEEGWFDEATKREYHRQGHPDFASFNNALYRYCGKGKVWIQEQQPGAVNWAGNNPTPLKGMVRLWTWEAFSHQVEVVAYFRWRQLHFGQEQNHSGLKLPNNANAMGWAEVEQVVDEIKLIEPLLDKTKKDEAEIALVFDYESAWMTEIDKQGADFNHIKTVMRWYTALRSLSINPDIVSIKADLKRYKAVFVPVMIVLNDDTIDRLNEVSDRVIIGPRSGSKTDQFKIPETLPPASLSRYLPIGVEMSDSFRSDLKFDLESSQGNDTGAGIEWRDLVTSDLQPLWHLKDDKTVGVVFEKGKWLYLAINMDQPTLKKIFKNFLDKIGIKATELPEGIRITKYKNLTFVFNYSTAEKEFSLKGKQLILGNKTVQSADISIWSD